MLCFGNERLVVYLLNAGVSQPPGLPIQHLAGRLAGGQLILMRRKSCADLPEIKMHHSSSLQLVH